MAIDILATPGENDIAYKWITVLFDTSTNSGFGAAFQVFTSMLGLLGGLFIGWHIISGIVASATSGKVLGEKYHQIWAPLRVVLGFGLMIPVAGGYSTVHYLLKDVVGKSAVNMGNYTITAYIDHLVEHGATTEATSMTGQQVARYVIEREICTTVFNTMQGLASKTVYGNISNPGKKIDNANGLANTDDKSELNYSGLSTKWDWGYCGSIMFNTIPQNGDQYGDDAVGRLNAYKVFHRAKATATSNMITALRSELGISVKEGENFQSALATHFSSKSYDEETSKKLIQEFHAAGILKSDFGSKMDAEIAKWNKAVADAASQVFQSAATDSKAVLSETVRKYGFMMAGAYERDLARISSSTSNLANNMPLLIKPDPGESYVYPYLAAFRAVMSSRTGESGTPQAEDGSDLMSRVTSILFPMGTQDAQDVSNVSGDPIGRRITQGQSMIAAALATITFMTAASGVAEGTGKSVAGLFGGGIVSGIFTYLAQWINYAIMVCMSVGIMYAVVLPMIPMIMVIVMGIGWLVMFLEAAIAGVLWAFAFIRMDGQDFFDRGQSPGVSLLFNLFLRPAIGMLAFIGGMIILPQILLTLDIVWGKAFYAQAGSSGLAVGAYNPITYLAMLVMGAWFQWHITLRIYGLVPQIADRVGHWMGFSSGGYQDASEHGRGEHAMLAAGAAMAAAPLMPRGRGRDGGDTPPPPPPPGGANPPPPRGGGGGGNPPPNRGGGGDGVVDKRSGDAGSTMSDDATHSFPNGAGSYTEEQLRAQNEVMKRLTRTGK